LKLLSIILLFVAASSSYAQNTLPTLSRNNAWTGVNSFVQGNLVLGSGQACTTGTYMTGFTSTFGPVCQSVSVGSGVTQINGTAGSITLANGTNINIVQSPTGTFTVNSTGAGGVTSVNGLQGTVTFSAANGITLTPSGNNILIGTTLTPGVTSINGLSSAVTLTAGANITLTQTSGTNITIAGTGGGGGGGSGTVNTGSPYQMVQYSNSATTTVNPVSTLYSLNSSMTLSQINALIASLNGGTFGQSYNVATIMVPEGVLPQGWTNLTSEATGQGNGGIGFDDVRSGARTEPLSRWGVTCNARQQGGYSFVSGSNQVTPVYTAFTLNDIGSTIAVVLTIGGVPTRFMPIITALNTGTGIATISTNAPITATTYGTIGFNNQAALQSAMLGLRITNTVGQFPAGCGLLTDTFQYRGPDSLQGDAGGPTTIYGVPGADIMQNPDGGAITAFSIASNVVTITGRNEFIPGQVVTVSGLQTGTYLNGAALTVLPTSLSATSWQAAFTHANVSTTADSGRLIPESLGGSTGLVLRNIRFVIDNGIDATLPWNSIDSNGVTTSHPGLYRPAAENTTVANVPVAPGWALNATNGVATTTQNSAVICVPTGLGRLPSVTSGNQLVFPNFGTVYQGTVTSLTGAGCASGTQGVTISPAIPNVSGNSQLQAEWISTTQINSLTTAISSGTITYPLVIHVSNSSAYIPGWENNVGSHGAVKIGSEEYYYIGGPNSVAPAALVLQGGPATTVGWAVGTAVVPQNPCPVARELPYPVTPSINTASIVSWSVASNQATFTISGTNTLQVGVSGYLFNFSGTGYFFNNSYVTVTAVTSSTFTVAFVHANASDTNGGTFNNATPMGATWFPGLCVGNAGLSMPEANGDVYVGNGYAEADIENLSFFATNNNDSNNAAAYYIAGNMASYASTYTNITASGTTFGIVQGPAGYANHGWAVVGPTGDGNHYSNLHLANAYNFIFDDLQDSTIERVDAYTTGWNPYSNTTIGAVTAFIINYTLDEQTGNVISNTAANSIDNINSEPENGTHIEIPPYAVFNCYNCTYTNADLEGIPTMLGGGSQTFIGGQFSTESFNYGLNNTVRNAIGAIANNLAPGYSFTTIQNFGSEFNESVPGGPNLWGAAFVRGSSDGQTDQSIMYGNSANFVDSKGGLIYPDEMGGMTEYNVYDPTATVSGHYTGCNLAQTSCTIYNFNGGTLNVGSPNRVPADKTVLSFSVKAAAAATGVGITVGATDDGSGSCATPNGNIASVTFNVTTGYTVQEVPVDFTNYTNCRVSIGFIGTSDLRFQYFDFLPVPTRLLLRNGTYTSGAACAVNGEFLGSDASQLYMCESGTVHTLPFGGGGGGGGGSVTSVAVTVPSFLSVSGSPVTTSGTIAISSGSFSGNTVLASPNGSTGALSVRALTANDIPTLPYITGGTGDVSFSGTGTVATTVSRINGQSLASLGSGLLQNTTGTGIPSIATLINVPGSVTSGTFSQSAAYIVPCTTTPVFDLSQGNTQILTLTSGCGTVTSSTVSNLPTGSSTLSVSVLICQDSAGGHAFPNPTWANGWNPTTQAPSQCTNTMFTATSAGLYTDGYNSAFCSVSGTSPLACGNAVKGFFAVPAGTNPTMTINTTAVGATSGIIVTQDETIGTSLSPTVSCGTSTPSGPIAITNRNAGTSFTLTVPGTITGYFCGFYTVVNQ
jgi:hypothetical protein